MKYVNKLERYKLMEVSIDIFNCLLRMCGQNRLLVIFQKPNRWLALWVIVRYGFILDVAEPRLQPISSTPLKDCSNLQILSPLSSNDVMHRHLFWDLYARDSWLMKRSITVALSFKVHWKLVLRNSRSQLWKRYTIFVINDSFSTWRRIGECLVWSVRRNWSAYDDSRNGKFLYQNWEHNTQRCIITKC